MLSRDGRQLLSSEFHARGLDPSVKEETFCLWDLATGKERRRLELRGVSGPPVWLTDATFSPDGRTLALAIQGETAVRLWEIASWQQRRKLEGHLGTVGSVAFAPDGRTLASASDDGTILLWDVAGVHTDKTTLLRGPTVDELETLWTALASTNAERAGAAVQRLALAPGQSVPFLRERLRPATAVEPERLARLLAGLESERYVIREKAARELGELHELARAPLLAALGKTTDLEARRRMEGLLHHLTVATPPPSLLRTLRALEILEQIGTPEAQRLLEELTKGIAEARLTREAQASVQRLARRKAVAP